MEESIYDGLQEMSNSLKQVEKFRASHRIKADARTKRRRIQMMEKLRTMETAIEQSLMGIV